MDLPGFGLGSRALCSCRLWCTQNGNVRLFLPNISQRSLCQAAAGELGDAAGTPLRPTPHELQAQLASALPHMPELRCIFHSALC